MRPAETYGRQVLGIEPGDRCLSAAKAFFAYGLGNSLLFPFSVGAASVLEPNPARPAAVAAAARDYGATLFFAGPTFFANMLRAGLAPDALGGQSGRRALEHAPQVDRVGHLLPSERAERESPAGQRLEQALVFELGEREPQRRA